MYRQDTSLTSNQQMIMSYEIQPYKAICKVNGNLQLSRGSIDDVNSSSSLSTKTGKPTDFV